MKLCIHFDINKTIIINDSSIGRSLKDGLNSLLTECVWGTFPKEKAIEELKITDWTPCLSYPSSAKPEDFPDSLSFGSYIEEYFTYLPKKQQRILKSKFTEEPYGDQFRCYFDELLTGMEMSSVEKEICEGTNLSYLSQGYYHILPSFFTFLRYIITLQQKGVEVRLILRSFGSDIAHVADEYNLFCTGKHPLFSSKYPLDGSATAFPYDLRIHLPYHTGRLLRTGDGAKDIHLAHINAHQVTTIISGANEIYQYLMHDWLGLASRCSRIEESAYAHCIALQDDFAYWHHCNQESDISGKLLLIHPKLIPNTSITPTSVNSSSSHRDNDRIETSSDNDRITAVENVTVNDADDDEEVEHSRKILPTTANEKNVEEEEEEQEIVQMFFDDNIEYDRAHIVDVRELQTFLPVPFSKTQQRVLFKVQPYEAILDQNYFVKIVQSVVDQWKSSQS